jgi:hypothetical protein|tara:strand:+ start:195 stop:596 length:402 start_codon:yes stop_codon:yes gene_type:complete
MKVYCPTCGSGTNYTITKPKFCAGCGEAFSALNTTPAKRIFRSDPQNPIATIQEEVEEEQFQMPNLDKLDIDIQSSKSFKVETLKDLAGTNIDGHNDGYVREADPTYSAESLAEDFLRDAGSASRNHEQTQET